MKGLNDIMRTKELLTDNYMEALLRAAILLGDLHRTVPVHEISISGFMIHDNVRKLYPRCKIVAHNEQCTYPVSTVIPSPLAENYLILYPLRKPLHSMSS